MNQPNLFDGPGLPLSAFSKVIPLGTRLEVIGPKLCAEREREVLQKKAELERELGISRTETASARVDPGFEARALDAVRTYAASHREFLAEDVRAVCPTPAGLTGRAWGSIMRKAQAAGFVHPCGFGRANSSNRGPKVLWRSLVFQEVTPCS